jgi:ABC-type nitrate/sulfonate/bicarbonate transport system permease component
MSMNQRLAVQFSPAGQTTAGGPLRRAAARTLSALIGLATPLVLVVLLWIGFLKAFSLDPLVAKSPSDVWTYLVSGADAAAHRDHVGSGLMRTLIDAGVGFAAGLAAAVAMALVFVLVRGVEQTLLPIAVVIRSIPLVAMTPLITLVFGRGLASTTVICGIVVYFPALVILAGGLRSGPRPAVELCRAYGGGSWTVARKVLIPAALPSLFAGARVGVPGALIGAMLAEWLATGQGLGYAMLKDPNTFDYTDLWASVAVLTFASIIVYNLVAGLEALVLARFGAEARSSA